MILLDQKKIEKFLENKSVTLEILEKTNSTNDYIKTMVNQKNTSISVCIAETQTHGRGRLSRLWHSPFGQNIYLSLRYPFQKEITELSGLSLVLGLAVRKAIEDNSRIQDPVLVKWPNDVVVKHMKIAGSLIEIQAESQGLSEVIIGIGINVNMQHASSDQINQPWTSIRALSGHSEDRNRLCAAVIDQILFYLQQFNDFGLKFFIEEWNAHDSLSKQTVRLLSNNNIVTGVGSGINEQGHLVLTVAEGIKQTFASGDTTLIK